MKRRAAIGAVVLTSCAVLTATAVLGACRSPSGPAIVPLDAPDSNATTRGPSNDAGVDSPPAASGTSSAAAPVGPPPVERACSADADCAVAQIEVSGDGVCCASCGTTPGSKRWYAELQRFCGPRPAWSNPKCGALACPAGPSVAICRDHRCEATWVGLDGGPAHVWDEPRCVPAWVCDAWSGCALVAGSTQNGYFVRGYDRVPRGELATMLRVCPGGAGCFDAASLEAPPSVCGPAKPPGTPPPGPAGYSCRMQPADHDAPEGHCVVGPASGAAASQDAGPTTFRCGSQTCRPAQYCLEIASGGGGAYSPGERAHSTKLECWDSLGSASVPCGPMGADRHARCTTLIPSRPSR